MNINRARLIRGWMNEDELTWLAKQAERHTKIVEVGSFLGRSCRALCDNTKGQVTSVDTWGIEHPAYGNTTGLFEKFQDNMIGLMNLRVIKKMSLDAANYLYTSGEQFDMIFIDADHSYDAVKADITAWKLLLSPWGVICGHDYDEDGVKRAVDETLPGAKLEAGSIWALNSI
jgi:predicted O-methyltransferase YrrM